MSIDETLATAKVMKLRLSINYLCVDRMRDLDGRPVFVTALSDVSRGLVRCHSVEGTGDEVVKLKRLGICGGHDIDVVQANDPMILLVLGTRIGISRQLAARVMVEPVAGTNESLTEGDTD